MKKFLFVAVLGALVACGEASTESTEPVADTTAAPVVDTTAAPVVDTTAVKADTTAAADTTKK